MPHTYYTVHTNDDNGIWLGEYADQGDAIRAARRQVELYDGSTCVIENRWSGSHWLPGRVVYACDMYGTLAA